MMKNKRKVYINSETGEIENSDDSEDQDNVDEDDEEEEKVVAGMSKEKCEATLKQIFSTQFGGAENGKS